ncbi:response regulator transcription factor [Pseudonocardia zijingensis]|uniref:response regulator transcription factor n=1 Tax=Pseudonocardia zijingensis TaxID=153376 RepID=UPI0031D4AED2
MLVVDRQPVFRRGLEEALLAATRGDVRVVAGTDRAETAAALVRRHQPDVALVDLELGPPGPLTALSEMRRVQPQLAVLALTRYTATHRSAVELLRAGAGGVLLRTRSPAGLVPSLLTATAAANQASGPQLTSKERHLWMLIAAGGTTIQIARSLHVSERTVKRLTANLLRALGVANRTEAAALAGRTGLLDDLSPDILALPTQRTSPPPSNACLREP